MTQPQISLLAQRPDFRHVIAARMHDKWPHRFVDDRSEDALALLGRSCRAVGLPLGLVAHDASTCLGYIQLDDSLAGSTRIDERVWLTHWLVLKPRRWLEVSSALIEAAETQAEQMGFDTLHIATRRGEDFLKERGWQSQEKVMLAGEPLAFMEKPLVKGRQS